jgi:signal transduction histidine kinase
MTSFCQRRQEQPFGENPGSIQGSEGDITSHGPPRLTSRQTEQVRGSPDSLLTIAAHEIRNPLNALRWQLQLALDSIRGRQDIPRDVFEILNLNLNRAIASTSTITRLIDDFTDLAFARGGELHLERRSLDLVAVINEMIQRTRTPDGGCPPIRLASPETLVGLWDRMRVEQVIANLLDNAVRFSNGQPIDVGADGNDATVELQVRDHGAGIPAEELERIFGPFQSVDRPSRSHPGLGLWIVREALASMGGKITVSSKLGEGSSFVVELPRR